MALKLNILYLVCIILLITPHTLALFDLKRPIGSISNSYIIVFRKETTDAAVSGAIRVLEAYGGRIRDHYVFSSTLNKIKMISLDMLDDRMNTFVFNVEKGIAERGIYTSASYSNFLSSISVIDFIEPNQIFQAQDSIVRKLEYEGLAGLDRLDQRQLPLNYYSGITSDGSGVNVYILDSGIRTTHLQFEGRAHFGYSYFDSGTNVGDCFGHGTHVAGIIGARDFGVAPGATLYDVRMLDCQGKGDTSSSIAALQWVSSNVVRPAIISMSIGGPISLALNLAVNTITDGEDGIIAVAASGNGGEDACNYSPGSAASAISVAACDPRDDSRASFSNYGSCVDIFAPGVHIFSTSAKSDSTAEDRSGTSMSTPFVAGVLAQFLSINPSLSVSQLRDALLDSATSSLISDPKGSPNLLLYSQYNSHLNISWIPPWLQEQEIYNLYFIIGGSSIGVAIVFIIGVFIYRKQKRLASSNSKAPLPQTIVFNDVSTMSEDEQVNMAIQLSQQQSIKAPENRKVPEPPQKKVHGDISTMSEEEQVNMAIQLSLSDG